MLQRAMAVVTERATRGDLPIVHVGHEVAGPAECAMFIVYRLAARAV